MGLLFLVALVLAWPTFGLSLVAWLILAWIKASNRVGKNERREALKPIIEPLFQGEFGEFFNLLGAPTISGELSDQEAHQCGRHVMNYLAQNPSEAALFIKGLDRWRVNSCPSLCLPLRAVRGERDMSREGPIHIISYRAIEAIMTNNPNLRCFSKISLSEVSSDLSELIDVQTSTRPASQPRP